MALSSAPRLYFAYGSSLALSEMKSRCPTSIFYSIAVLRNHRWFVNERGYANVVPSLPGADAAEHVVWGILYTLRPFDEELLDKHEGIPWAYSKVDMDVEAIGITEDARGTRREVVRALVYIDRERVQESYPWPEFILKMNKGINEAVERGLPVPWIDKVVRPYMMDPSSTVNGGERPIQLDKTARPSSVIRPESDRDSQAHENQAGGQTANGEPQSPRSNHASQSSHAVEDHIVGGHFVNGGSQKIRSNNNSQSYGLEKSKYAHEGRTSGAQQRTHAGTQGKTGTPFTKGQGSKMIECWYWRTKGACRHSADECQFAHYETGNFSEAPGTSRKAPSQENKGGSFQQKNVSRWERSPSKPFAGIEIEKQPYGYQQDWSAMQQD